MSVISECSDTEVGGAPVPPWLFSLLDRSAQVAINVSIMVPAGTSIGAFFTGVITSIDAAVSTFPQDVGDHPDAEFAGRLLKKYVAREMHEMFPIEANHFLILQVVGIDTDMFMRRASECTDMWSDEFESADAFSCQCYMSVINEDELLEELQAEAANELDDLIDDAGSDAYLGSDDGDNRESVP